MTGRRAVIAWLLLAVAGCGFQPLYGSGPGGGEPAAVPEMAAIEIAPIADRGGQLLHNELRDRLMPRGRPGSPRWRLDLTLNEARADLVILQDATATFAKYTGDARWVLSDIGDGAPVLRGRARRTASFSISSSEFANLQAEEDARRRVVAAIADDIRLRLALHFRRPGS